MWNDLSESIQSEFDSFQASQAECMDFALERLGERMRDWRRKAQSAFLIRYPERRKAQVTRARVRYAERHPERVAQSQSDYAKRKWRAILASPSRLEAKREYQRQWAREQRKAGNG